MVIVFPAGQVHCPQRLFNSIAERFDKTFMRFKQLLEINFSSCIDEHAMLAEVVGFQKLLDVCRRSIVAIFKETDQLDIFSFERDANFDECRSIVRKEDPRFAVVGRIFKVKISQTLEFIGHDRVSVSFEVFEKFVANVRGMDRIQSHLHEQLKQFFCGTFLYSDN